MKHLRRTASALIAAAALAVVLPSSPARADDFSPTISVTRSSNAARAAAGLTLKAEQPDGQEQVGSIKLRLPGAFTFNTDAAGDGAQIGTLAASLYINPRPSTLTITGTIHDNNHACPADAPPPPYRQCMLALVSVPGVGDFEISLVVPIDQVTGDYVVEADIASLWSEDYVRGIDGRLKDITLAFPARVGNHVVFRNPQVAAEDYTFTYELRSARIDALGYTGGRSPACGDVCSVLLPAREANPSVPSLRSPGHGSVTTSATNVTFSWNPSNDANGDAVSYVATVTGPAGVQEISTNATSAPVGALAPGAYTWKVVATDATGRQASTATASFRVLDRATAVSFTATSGDSLLVFAADDIVIYRLAGPATLANELSATQAGLEADRGVLNVETPAFRLAGAYESTAKTAALTLVPTSGGARTFTDLPG